MQEQREVASESSSPGRRLQLAGTSCSYLTSDGKDTLPCLSRGNTATVISLLRKLTEEAGYYILGITASQSYTSNMESSWRLMFAEHREQNARERRIL
jgi:hypothetical protein